MFDDLMVHQIKNILDALTLFGNEQKINTHTKCIIIDCLQRITNGTYLILLLTIIFYQKISWNNLKIK